MTPTDPAPLTLDSPRRRSFWRRVLFLAAAAILLVIGSVMADDASQVGRSCDPVAPRPAGAHRGTA